MSIAADVAAGSVARPLKSSRTLIYIYTFFFVSGMPALIYQLAWQRVLFRIFGLSMDSVTVIVTAFMLGLGVGSLAGSALSASKRMPPLLLVTMIELAVGAFGILSLPLFASIDPIVQDMTLIQRSLIIIGIVFVPTALMGATLPLLIGQVVAGSANVGFSTGSLYRINALGGVAGCVLGALVFFPFLGLKGSVFAAAILNGVVGAIAAAAYFSDKGDHATQVAPSVFPPRTMRLTKQAARALVLFSGFVSLSFEIYFLHLTSFATATNAVILAIELGVFLLGIASGAREAGEWARSGAKYFSPALCRTLLAGGIAGLVVLPLLAATNFLGNGILGIIVLATFFVASSLGAVFPLVAHLSVPADDAAGAQAGLLYLANIIGAAAGSMLTGFVLCDVFGIRALALLLSALAMIMAVPLVWRFSLRPQSMLALPLGVVTLLALFQYPLTRGAIDSMLFRGELANSSPITRVVENRYGIAAVSKDGTVYGGGIYDGHFNTDLLHDNNGIIRAYSLSLFHPAPRDVFMIGLSSGSWAQVIAANPEVRHLTVVEINPGYLPLIQERSEVRSLLRNPKVTIIIDDANRWLRRHPHTRYDAIVANATYHFRANASTLLSQEFNQMIGTHLNRGGVYLYNATGSERVERTGCEDFRHGYRFFHFMLVGNDPIAPDAARWERNLLATRIDGRPILDIARPETHRHLAINAHIAVAASARSTDPDLVPLEPCASVLYRTVGKKRVTDDNMGTEWRYPLGLD